MKVYLTPPSGSDPAETNVLLGWKHEGKCDKMAIPQDLFDEFINDLYTEYMIQRHATRAYDHGRTDCSNP